ncbi:MAG TPA: CHAT domain-containing protein [Acidobacteriota bacterium]|nr:CHAT domain-containing protein [Acidobacteriota bacterium]
MKRGQLVDVRAEQGEADLVATLLDPEGRTILAVDYHLPGRAERLAYIAPSDGTYRLIVRLYDPSDEPLAYRLVADKLGPPDAAEHHFAEGLLSFYAASQRQGRPEHSHEDVLTAYRKVETQFAESGAVFERAETLKRMGWEWSHLGRIDAEIDCYAGASELLLPVSPEESAVFMNRIGYAYRESGFTAQALESHHQALAILRSNPSSTFRHQSAEAQSLNGLGLLEWTHGDPHEALTYYREALKISKRIGAKDSLADTLDNIGLVYGPIGLFDAALDKFREGLELRVSLGDTAGQAATRTEIGWLYYRFGRTQEAIEEYQAALGLCGQGCRTRQGTLDRLGTAYRELGRFQEALETYRESIGLSRARGRNRDEAHTTLNLCHLFESWGRLAQAEDHCDQAEQAFETIGDPTATSHVAFLRSRIRRKQDLLEEALDFARQAVEDVNRQRERFASAALRVSLIVSRGNYYRHYVDLLMTLHSQRADEGYDKLALAADQESKAQGLSDALLEDPPSDPQIAGRLRALRDRINALQWTRVMLDESDSAQAERLSEVDRQLREVRQEVDRIEYQVRRKSGLESDQERLSIHRIQSEFLDAETAMLVFALGNDQLYAWGLSSNAFRSALVPQHERILRLAEEYRRLLERSYARSSRERLRIVEEDLSEMLLTPLASFLDWRRVVIVAEGPLSTIPFSTLLLPVETAPAAQRSRLGDEHELISLPSIAVLPALRVRNTRAGRPSYDLVLFTDPVVNPADKRLRGKQPAGARLDSDPWQASSLAEIESLPRFHLMPQAGFESDAITSLAGEKSTLPFIGFDATRANALRFLSDSRIVHFTAHGFFTEQPELSALVLSLFHSDGRLSPGFLWSLELQDLDVRADLVVLASCGSAWGSNVPREGVLGLGRAFLHAGAKSTLVSLWRVDDEATMELIREFYRQLWIEGKGPSEALRLAQRHLRSQNKWRAPAFWAGFVLQGDWKHESFAYP